MKNLWTKMKEKPDKWMFVLLLAAFAAVMLPVLYLSRYAVPGCDDYTYGIKTHGAWLDTGSLWEVVKAAAETTADYWHHWQGTYSSIFLMTLSPGILEEKWYFLTTFVMTGMLCGSIGCLVHVVLKKYVGETAGYRRGICMLVLWFLAIQTMVAPSDGLYWYNGALHYVFMESVLFFAAAVLLSYWKAQKAAAQAGYLLLAVILAFVLGGANLLTGLQSCILTVLFVLYAGWTQYRKRAAAGKRAAGEVAGTDSCAEKGADRVFRRRIWLLLLPLLVNLAGFGCNVLAPGNSIRETTAEGMGAVKAVILSFYWAAVYVTEWLTPLVLAGFVLLCPVIWRMVKKAKARFFGPLYSVGLSFCVYAAMFTPTLFATSSDGPDRCKNVIRVALYLLVFLNLVNAFGWFAQKKPESLVCRLQETIREQYLPWLLGCSIVMGCLLLLAADKNTYTSVSALRSIANGEAAVYYEENERRLALYQDAGNKDVTITRLTAKPYLLFKEDVGNEGSPDYWINISVRDYYRKDSVTVTD